MNRVQVVDFESRRRIFAVLLVTFFVLGGLSIKRIVNGNGDLSGNYAVWSANLKEPIQPGRHLSTELRLGDPDPYPPITYAIFAQLARLPLWLLAALWFMLNVGCTFYLWKSLEGMLDDQYLTTGTLVEPRRKPDIGEINFPPESSLSNQVSLPDVTELKPDSNTSHVKTSVCDNRMGYFNQLSERDWIMLLAGIAVLPSWIGALLIGQNTLFVMTLVTVAYRSDVSKWTRCLRVGACLALAVAMKVLPVVFLLPFVVRRQFRVLIGFAICGCVLLFGIGSLFFGVDKNREFHVRWLEFAIKGPENRPPDPRDPNTLRGSLRDKNQAIEAVLARLLMDVPIHSRDVNAPRINVASVSPSVWRLSSSSLLLTCVSIGILTVIFSQRARNVSRSLSLSETSVENSAGIAAAARRDSVLGQLAILGPTQLFISPVLWSHYYLWLIFPIALTLFEIRNGRSRGSIIFGAWLIAIPCLGVELCRAAGLHLWMTLVIYLWVCWPALRYGFRQNCEFVGKRIQMSGSSPQHQSVS